MAAATVTTQVNRGTAVQFVPTARIFTAPTYFAVIALVPVSRTGLVRLVMPPPLRRWDGTTWTYVHRPRV